MYSEIIKISKQASWLTDCPNRRSVPRSYFLIPEMLEKFFAIISNVVSPQREIETENLRKQCRLPSDENVLARIVWRLSHRNTAKIKAVRDSIATKNDRVSRALSRGPYLIARHIDIRYNIFARCRVSLSAESEYNHGCSVLQGDTVSQPLMRSQEEKEGWSENLHKTIRVKSLLKKKVIITSCSSI